MRNCFFLMAILTWGFLRMEFFLESKTFGLEPSGWCNSQESVGKGLLAFLESLLFWICRWESLGLPHIFLHADTPSESRCTSRDMNIFEDYLNLHSETIWVASFLINLFFSVSLDVFMLWGSPIWFRHGITGSDIRVLSITLAWPMSYSFTSPLWTAVSILFWQFPPAPLDTHIAQRTLCLCCLCFY